MASKLGGNSARDFSAKKEESYELRPLSRVAAFTAPGVCWVTVARKALALVLALAAVMPAPPVRKKRRNEQEEKKRRECTVDQFLHALTILNGIGGERRGGKLGMAEGPVEEGQGFVVVG